MKNTCCVVLAGGLGKRISSITENRIPKALVPVLNRPFLDYKLISLRRMGFEEIHILTGELGELIEDHVSSIPQIRLRITVHHDGPQLLGTAGAIAKVCPSLPPTFWVSYADSIVTTSPLDAERALGEHSRIMCVLYNHNEIQPSNVSIHQGVVTAYTKDQPDALADWIDYGLLKLRNEDFWDIPKSSVIDLSVVLHALIQRQELLAWPVSDRFWDIGTPTALAETTKEILAQDWSDLW